MATKLMSEGERHCTRHSLVLERRPREMPSADVPNKPHKITRAKL